MDKYMRLVSMLLVSFLALTIVLSTVSATEIGNTDTTSNIELKDTVSTDIETFTDLNNELSQKNCIELNEDINITSDDIKSLEGHGLFITQNVKNVTIDGKGHYIDAKDLFTRMFNIKSDGSLTLINITLKNGIGDRGGAIYNEGFLTLINCTVINNEAKYHGGAIYNMGSLTVTNCTFVDNHVWNHGGAIYSNSSLTVTNCTFIGNKLDKLSINSYNQGGAIYTKGNLTLINCNFLNNSINGEGGSVYSNSLVCMNSYFNHNSAELGGAISCSDCRVNNCTFINNNACSAGAISCSDGRVDNCTFISNTAGEGGAIRGGTCKVNNCIFRDNSATGKGGAITVELRECKNCTFLNNTARDGGALYIWKSSIKIEIIDCIFKDNKATKYGLLHAVGGAIYSEKSHISLIHNQWINNKADRKGDRVYNEGWYDTIEYNYFAKQDEVNFREEKFGKDAYHLDSHPYYDLTAYYNHAKLNCVDKLISNENFVDNCNWIKPNNLLSTINKPVNSNHNQDKISSNDYVNKNSVSKQASVAKSSNENTISTSSKNLFTAEKIVSQISKIIPEQLIFKVSECISDIQNTLKTQNLYVQKSYYVFMNTLREIIS